MTPTTLLILGLMGFNPTVATNPAATKPSTPSSQWTCSASDPMNHAVAFGYGPTREAAADEALLNCSIRGGMSCHLDFCNQ